jgi:hypothetical protein
VAERFGDVTVNSGSTVVFWTPPATPQIGMWMVAGHARGSAGQRFCGIFVRDSANNTVYQTMANSGQWGPAASAATSGGMQVTSAIGSTQRLMWTVQRLVADPTESI